MSKPNALILFTLCKEMEVDIIELSVYELLGRVNTQETIEEDGWNICQKIGYWIEDENVGLNVVRKVSTKV